MIIVQGLLGLQSSGQLFVSSKGISQRLFPHCTSVYDALLVVSVGALTVLTINVLIFVILSTLSSGIEQEKVPQPVDNFFLIIGSDLITSIEESNNNSEDDATIDLGIISTIQASEGAPEMVIFIRV